MSGLNGTDISSSSNPQDSLDSLNEKPYTDQGINEKIVQKIRSLIDIGKLNSSDIDNRVCEQLRAFPDESTSIDTLFTEFNNSDLTGVVNKGAFLCNFIKQWKIRNPQQPKSSTNDSQAFGDNSRTHKPGPDEAKLKQVLDRTGYKIEVTAGQRKYGGPPPDGPERPAFHSEVRISLEKNVCFIFCVE
jgi:heterogeneous nuclear ribonucleoprotein R